MNLESLKPFLTYQFKSESELIKSIEQISVNFTKNRENISEYIKGPKLVSAYSCFYLLTNIPKLSAVLDKIKIDLQDYSDWQFVDIGAGPGTFSLALLEENKDLDICAVEQSENMIELGERIISGLYPQSKHKYYSHFQKVPRKNKKRFGIFGHSANEMSVELVKQMIENLELDSILFIEPGTKDFFKKSLEIRQELLIDYKLHYPCPTMGECPLEGRDDWCHQYLKISHQTDVERLTQLLHKDRRNLPIIIHFYAKESSLDVNSDRIIRVYKPTKFSLEWQVCSKEETKNNIVDLQILTRPYKKAEIKKLQTVLAGDGVKFSIIKILGDNKVRGEL